MDTREAHDTTREYYASEEEAKRTHLEHLGMMLQTTRAALNRECSLGWRVTHAHTTARMGQEELTHRWFFEIRTDVKLEEVS